MTATTTFSPSGTTATPHTTSTKSLWKAGIAGGIVAGVATSAVAATAHAAGISLKVSGKAIPVLGFAQLTIVGALIGTVLAIVLSHRARRPQRAFVRTTVTLTLASLVPDVLANAHTTTRFTLAVTHVVAAAIVIPALASRLEH
jgi:hypothetical protein